MATPVQMPKQGITVEECNLVAWRVKEGDVVKAGDILCEIETDKATFEVESPASGTVLKLFRKAGELVPVLTNIAAIGTPGEDVSSLAPEGVATAAPPHVEPQPKPSTPSPAAEISAPSTIEPTASSASPTTEEKRISPRARAVGERLGVDPSKLVGTGAKGRVTSRDVQAAADRGERMTPAAKAEAAETSLTAGIGTGVGGRIRMRDLGKAAPTAAVPAVVPTPGEAPAVIEIPYKGIRKIIGDRMMESLSTHAQLTLHSSADATAILAYRQKVKGSGEAMGLPDISLNAMVMYVVAKTLPQFPDVNAVFDKAKGVIRQYRVAHLAFACDTPKGLLVPVIRDADTMSLAQLASRIAELASQAKSGSIPPDLLSGGTFTVTNLGSLGIESFTPVLNTPQVAILGICAIDQKAIPDGKGGVTFQPRIGLSLTIDHQVVDGAPASRFLTAVANGIANFELLLAR